MGLLFLFGPTSKSVPFEQLGSVLLQTGIATLLVGFVSFELLVAERIPQAIFRHGYFRIADRAEREQLFKSSVGALVDLDDAVMDDADTIFPTYYPAVRDFVAHTFAAPARYEYKAVVELGAATFDELSINPGESGMSTLHSTLLTVNIAYSYAARNRLAQSVRVNHDGVVHRVDMWIPQELALHTMLMKGGSKRKTEIVKWIELNMNPLVWVQIDNQPRVPIQAQVSPKDIVIAGEANDLRLQFPVHIRTRVQPGSNIHVYYTQRSAARLRGEHHWVAFGVTQNFEMSQRGFDDKGFGVIPIVESTPWSRQSGGAPEQPRARVDHDHMICLTGLVFPGATFGYCWYPSGTKAARPSA